MNQRLALSTVAVVHPEGGAHGAVVINERDFDPAVHTKWAESGTNTQESDTPSAAVKPPKRGSKP